MLRIKIKVPKRLGIRKRAKYDSQLPLTLEGGIGRKKDLGQSFGELQN